MDMGHLYHDAVFGDPILALDVKEQLRTREINACEEMNLARKSQIYDRAIDLCEKTSNYEKWRIAQTLNMVLERSPHLDQSLAIEKARLEMLHNMLLRRAAKANKEQSSTPHTSTGPRFTVSAKRPVTRKGRSALKSIGRRRRQDREKSRRRKREEGPILNTDLNFERHLQRKSLYSKRNEHAVKTLARINWQMETRRRDHRCFQENLVRFSKPLIERARMVLRGRPDMDVEQFLQEFEDFLYPRYKVDAKPGQRKARGKRLKDKESPISTNESEVTLVQLNEEEDERFRSSNVDASVTSNVNITNRDILTVDQSQDSSVTPTAGLEETHHSNQLPNSHSISASEELSSKLRSLTLSLGENSCKNLKDPQRDKEEGNSAALRSSPSKSRPSSEREGSFHLPAIVATKSDVMNLKSRPGSSTTADQAIDNSEKTKVNEGHEVSQLRRLRLKAIDLNNNEFNNDNKPLKITNHDIDSNSKTNNSSCSNLKKEHDQKFKKVKPQASESLRISEFDEKAQDDDSNLKSTTKSPGYSSTPSTILSQIIQEEEESEPQNHDSALGLSMSNQSSLTQLFRGKVTKPDRNDTTSDKSKKLPALKTHGKDSSSFTITSKGIDNQNRNDRESWRKGPELTDVFHARERRHLSPNKDRTNAEGKLHTFKEQSYIANDMQKKDLFQAIIDNFKMKAYQDSKGAKNLRDLQHFNSRHSRNMSHSKESALSHSESFSLPSVVDKGDASPVNVATAENGSDDRDETNQNKSNGYTLTCTLGLPKLWKQSAEQKKDGKATPEVSPAAIARRQRRSRTKSQKLF
ncbi:hypothetical protein PoB_007526200 [Plakobranchus ocellatus]|uniref:Shugoshin C-terminal domain-containing protein n=1 Tax=Plakobranchus ocellatus TaxID=259542 RepID=A0AAV4DXK8_9GAST|nr:hypothetical protein PoB_007526200 [Plakobranchus ocellatus]